MFLNLTFVKASQSSNDALFCLVANTFNILLKVGSLLLHGSGLCGCGLLCVARLLGGFGFLCGLHLFGWSCLLRFVSRFGLFWNDRLLEAVGWAQFHLGARILLELVFFLLVYRLHSYICWLSAVYAWFGTGDVEKSRGCKNAFCHGQARPRFRSYRMDLVSCRLSYRRRMIGMSSQYHST